MQVSIEQFAKEVHEKQFRCVYEIQGVFQQETHKVSVQVDAVRQRLNLTGKDGRNTILMQSIKLDSIKEIDTITHNHTSTYCLVGHDGTLLRLF